MKSLRYLVLQHGQIKVCPGTYIQFSNDGKTSNYRGSLSTVYSDGDISTCGEIIGVHSVQSTMMGRSQHVGRL